MVKRPDTIARNKARIWPKVPCKVEGCSELSVGRGHCSKHWQRWRRNGHTDLVRPKVGEPLRFLNEVVLTYSGDECLIWPFAQSHGYGQMNFHGRVVEVHRLVCELVNGDPPTPRHIAMHSCNNDLACVTPRHIRWGTRVQLNRP